MSLGDRQQLIEYIKDFKFVPGGRYLWYAGRKNHYYNNCYLLRAEHDTREEWADLTQRAVSCLMTGGGIPIHESKGYMIVDIGGGTTDVAVISLGGIVASTSVKCAGNKIDAAIADYIKKTFNLAIGDKTAEEVKIKIGAAVPLEEELKVTIKGRDFIQGLPRSAQVGTNEIVKAIDGELKQIIKAIKDVLGETPPELASDIIDHGIIMTGGSSLLRNLADLVYRKTGVKAAVADDALYCVAKGTGIALEHLEVYKKAILSKK
jgi:rod shape-determining protein MreB